MKKPFKVGDRIRIYGVDKHCKPVSVVTTVEEVLDNGLLYVNEKTAFKAGAYDLTLPHVKQCRRLVKKPSNLQRIWVPATSNPPFSEGYKTPARLWYFLKLKPGSAAEAAGLKFIEFIEVRPKKGGSR